MPKTVFTTINKEITEQEWIPVFCFTFQILSTLKNVRVNSDIQTNLEERERERECVREEFKL